MFPVPPAPTVTTVELSARDLSSLSISVTAWRIDVIFVSKTIPPATRPPHTHAQNKTLFVREKMITGGTTSRLYNSFHNNIISLTHYNFVENEMHFFAVEYQVQFANCFKAFVQTLYSNLN